MTLPGRDITRLPSSDESILFSLRQLGVSYRARPVLRGIDWTWRRGEHWAVLGQNGAGKTTLARVLSGEQAHYCGAYERSERLDAGGIAYVGFEAGHRLMQRDQRRDCAEFADEAADTGATIEQLLRCAPERAAARDALLDLLHLRPVLDRGLRYVSTGELRKGLLARAILARPELLILDSPLDGLDRATQARFGRALNTIIRQSPAVLVLCRSEGDVPPACAQVLLLDGGRKVLAGPRARHLHSERVRTVLAAPELALQAPPAAPARPSAGRDVASIDLRNVQASFGERCVFRELNWRFEAHHHCLIAGPNGCGKTTLLDMLTGDNHKAYGQQVRLFGRLRGSGESVWDIKARFGRVDAKLQYAVPSGSRVLDVVLSGYFDALRTRETPSDAQRRTALEWLGTLGMAASRDEEFHTLSFGLQRLVLLARAMVKSPAILLLDEATLSLDAGHRRLLLDAIDHVVGRYRCQLLFVSHTPGEVPSCINQLLRFTPAAGGSRVTVRDYPGCASDSVLGPVNTNQAEGRTGTRRCGR